MSHYLELKDDNVDNVLFVLKVPCWNELLCGVDAAIPHCNCIGIDDFDAINLSMQLWSAPWRYV